MGVPALVEQRRGLENAYANRVAPEIEKQILTLSLEFPAHGAQRVANELGLREVNVSPSGVRGVWLRHDLESHYK